MEIVDREIDVSQIDATTGPNPSDRMVESVRRNGVVVPVILAERVSEDGEIFFAIVDGNRRISSAREADVGTVPARVVRGASEAGLANLTLLTNNFRTSNYVTEFWAMNELQRAGVPRKNLAEATGWTPSTLATREHLSQLERRLFVGLSEGRISPTVALAAAKLDRDVQERLGDRFQQSGRLTKRDVDEVAPPKPPGDLPEIDAEGRVLPEDLHMALVAIARQTVARGIDEETWTGATARAFREASRG